MPKHKRAGRGGYGRYEGCGVWLRRMTQRQSAALGLAVASSGVLRATVATVASQKRGPESAFRRSRPAEASSGLTTGARRPKQANETRPTRG
jgi:hypothetical protein